MRMPKWSCQWPEFSPSKGLSSLEQGQMADETTTKSTTTNQPNNKPRCKGDVYIYNHGEKVDLNEQMEK